MSDNPLFSPPRLFKDVTFHRHTDRQVGWLELFYDLVYVATLIQIGNFLSDNLSVLGFLRFLVMLIVVWWAWTGETYFQNRYVVDDIPHRLLVFGQMMAIATLGLSVSEAFGDLYVQFTLAYVVTRFMLLLMYVRTYILHPQTREFSRLFVQGYAIGIAIWMASLLLPAEQHWVGWMIGIAFELTMPLRPRLRAQYRLLGTDYHHIAERFGIFTIIVLGESFVKVLDDAQGTVLGPDQAVFSFFGFTVLMSMWWLYFSDTAGKIIDFSARLKPVLWTYGHLPLAAGLVAFGVGAKKLYASTLSYPNDPLNEDYRLLYTASIVLYLAALALIDVGMDDEETPQNQQHQTIMHAACAVLVGVIGLALVDVTPTGFVAIIAAIMFVQVVYSVYETRLATTTALPHQESAAAD